MHVAFQIPYVYDTKQSNPEDKQKSFTIMNVNIYAILDKAKPHTENIRGFNFAAVIYTTIRVSTTAVVWANNK
jgi:hypothetical protein